MWTPSDFRLVIVWKAPGDSQSRMARRLYLRIFLLEPSDMIGL